MNATARDMKLPAIVALIATTALMLLGGSINQAKAEEVVCTDFELRYNGKIGKVDFPKGIYSVIGIDKERIACDYALENFEIFLQNFYGKTNKPWLMSSKVEEDVRSTTFRRGKKSKVGFTITPDLLDSTRPPIKEEKACKGSYKFKNGTRIGSFKIPKGSYRLGSLDEDNLSCGESAKQFRKFLKRRKLTSDWKLAKGSATFSKRGQKGTGFFITKNVSAPASDS